MRGKFLFNSQHFENNLFLLFLLIICIFISNCSNIQTSSKRLGKDCIVVCSYPIHAPVASAVDAFEATKEKPVISIPTIPINFFIHFIKHTYATMPYMLDMPFYPFYVFFGVEPIKIYKIEGFPYELNSDTLNDGARRGSISGMVFFCSPISSLVSASHDSYHYYESHPFKRYFYIPILFPSQTLKHLSYSLVYGIDFCFYPLTILFGENPIELYKWSNYPFEVAPHLNKSANRIYKDFETVLFLPLGILVRSGVDFGKSFKNHPVATSIFSFVVFPYEFIKHTIFHLAYLIDLTGTPFHVFNISKDLDTYELYITGSFETHPVEKSILGQRIIAFFIMLGSSMSEAATERAYQDNPTVYNYERMMEAKKDAEANRVVANTYLQQAMAMRDALSNVRGFRRPKTAMEFLKFLGEGKEKMDKLEGCENLSKNDVSANISASLMQKYRDVMNLVLYQREKKLFEESRTKILQHFGSTEISGSRVDQLAYQSDIANLIQIQDALMEAYLAIPGTKGQSQQSIDELGDCCDKILQAIDHEIERPDSQFNYMLKNWKKKIYHIQNREYTQDAIYSEIRKLLSDGYLKIYEYQTVKK